METAPRQPPTEGTAAIPIELCYARKGGKPWYGLFAWTNRVQVGPSADEAIPRIYPQEKVAVSRCLGTANECSQALVVKLKESEWVNLTKPGHGIGDEKFFLWRVPETTDPKEYEALNLNKE